MIDKDKTYRTRDGREVRIYATDGGGLRPIHGAVKDGEMWDSLTWYSDGHYSFEVEDDEDLIEVKPRIKRTVWLNLYETGKVGAFTDEADAHTLFSQRRLACVKVEIDCEEGEGLEPQRQYYGGGGGAKI